MFFGSGKPQNTAPSTDEAFIFDVGIDNFEARVLHESMEKPVVVQFHAPWCGPCKQLAPVLEKAVRQTGGKILLARIDIDQNAQLAAALRVQSVPTVMAFFGGRPVDAFQGAQAPSQVNNFIAKLEKIAGQANPGALDIPETLQDAAQKLAAGDLAGAQGLYAAILQQDEHNVDAYIGLIRTLIAADALEEARALIETAPETISKTPKFVEAQTALDLASKPHTDLGPLLEKVARNPKDQQARLDLAEAQFADGQHETAINTLLDSIAQDRAWNEEAARKMLLQFFQALGHSDPLTVQGRKRLSSLLFS